MLGDSLFGTSWVLAGYKPGRDAKHSRPKPGVTCAFIGADDGTRTRDPNLGKVVLYQLSYSRAL